MKFIKKNTPSQSPDNASRPDLDRFRKKKRTKRLLGWVVGLVVVGLFLWYLITILVAFNRVTAPKTDGSPTHDLRKLTEEQQAPINMLLIGVGGDGHPGGNLADSIMVISMNVKANTVSMVSIPRDLYVNVPNHGKEKINAANTIGKSKAEGSSTIKKVVADVLGIPIHYYVRIDFDGFRKVIDTLGGVTVDVKNAINDPQFPNATLNGFEPFKLAAGKQTLDGKTALKYVRSRHSSGSEGSDFARARRQQELLVAAKDKVLSAGVLTNPKKITNLITIVGNHLLTDLSTGEIEQLVGLSRAMSNPTTRSFVFDTSEKGLLSSSTTSGGAYILVPRAGANDFSQIQSFTRAYVAQPIIQSEKPTIQIQRGPATKEQVARIQYELETAGFVVMPQPTVAPSPTTKKATTTLFDMSEGKKERSRAFLVDQYKVTVTKQAKTDATAPDFTLELGSDVAKILKPGTAVSASSLEGHKALKTELDTNEEESIGQGAN